MQPTLFGEWSLVREFGRIGSPGRVVATNHHTFAQASAALESLRAAKERKGYTAEC
ncbi:WGR domain-containing protein [Pleomorphomonas carboxyditropha]